MESPVMKWSPSRIFTKTCYYDLNTKYEKLPSMIKQLKIIGLGSTKKKIFQRVITLDCIGIFQYEENKPSMPFCVVW
ncbi:hypothetical protein Avbf_16524 [Armadillidium vulgare]|nr:hypothetical protein Avbf_16524 [Armadillidium vulgare]